MTGTRILSPKLEAIGHEQERALQVIIVATSADGGLPDDVVCAAIRF
jgi:hypothetical protein